MLADQTYYDVATSRLDEQTDRHAAMAYRKSPWHESQALLTCANVAWAFSWSSFLTASSKVRHCCCSAAAYF